MKTITAQGVAQAIADELCYPAEGAPSDVSYKQINEYLKQAFMGGVKFSLEDLSIKIDIGYECILTNAGGDTFTFPFNSKYEELVDFLIRHQEYLKKSV